MATPCPRHAHQPLRHSTWQHSVGQGVTSHLEHRHDMLFSTLYDDLMATGVDGADIVHGQCIELDLARLEYLICRAINIPRSITCAL
jgi:hypothetical protein